MSFMSCLFMSCYIIVRYIILTVHILHQKLFGVLHDWQVIVMLRYLAGKHFFLFTCGAKRACRS